MTHKGGYILKKPIMLLFAIVMSVIMLSILFPLEPEKMDFITKLRLSKEKHAVSGEVAKDYKIINVSRLSDSGRAIAWSPDEKGLYCSLKVKDSDEQGLEELWLLDLQGNRNKINSKIKLYNINSAKWSPDGSMLAFISTQNDRNSLIVYDTKNNSLKDVTPKKILDVGVTSYDWDNESLNIIMSIDISSPRIEIYDIRSGKSARLDMNLRECRNVSFYTEGKIIFSDTDGEKYRIYEADRYGKNVAPITEGWDYVISPDRNKIAILSDGDGQRGLWIYNTFLNEKSELSVSPLYKVYWLNNSSNLMYSMEIDSKRSDTYKGNIYYYGKDIKTITVSGAIYTVFLPSASGGKIAMTSPDSTGVSEENTGIFIGNLYK